MILVIASSCKKEPTIDQKPVEKTFIQIEAVDPDGHIVVSDIVVI
jgi:hypothetical protein